MELVVVEGTAGRGKGHETRQQSLQFVQLSFGTHRIGSRILCKYYLLWVLRPLIQSPPMALGRVRHIIPSTSTLLKQMSIIPYTNVNSM